MLKLKNNYKNSGAGFTLVELLVVITILGVLATIGLVAFASAQMRGRDSQRKSDLKQLSNALEVFSSDYGKYPPGSGGLISGCQYNPVNGTGGACSWGGGPFWDGKTTYFETLPKDPSSGSSYYYQIVDSGTNQKFQLFAHLENTQDPNCLLGSTDKPSCTSPVDVPSGVTCGSGNCNFAITSTNTTPTATPAP
jgi:type II secretion system protein G